MVKTHHMQLSRFSSKPRKPKLMKPVIDLVNLHCDVCNKTYGSKSIYMKHVVRLHEMTLLDIYSEQSNFDREGLYCKYAIENIKTSVILLLICETYII